MVLGKAMTFVHTGNRVTFLLCDLKTNGFQIKRMNNYSLPMKLKESTIYSLTDLIINITTQFIDSKEREEGLSSRTFRPLPIRNDLPIR